MGKTVLVIDDDQNMRWVLQRALALGGLEVVSAPSGEAGLVTLAMQTVDVVLLDLKLGGMDGLATLKRIRQMRPEVPVILLTAYASVPTAVEAMRLGATDYLRKPFDVEEVRFALAKAMERGEMAQELARLSTEVKDRYSFQQVSGSQRMAEILPHLEAASRSRFNVLLVGERGTGKSTLARSIHYNSSLSSLAPVEIACGVLSEGALRKELAKAASSAAGGCIVVDDVDRLSPALQAELADLLSDHHIRALATATDPTKIGQSLREVLGEIEIDLPPLRERRDDVALLAKRFLGERELSAAALQAISRYDWPGNVAELKSVLERATCLTDGQVEVHHLPEAVGETLSSSPSPFRLPREGVSLENVERGLIVQALEQSHGNKTKAAELLGLSRHTLLYRLEKYGLGG
ncbi:MAG: sigma-54 dependent transcriptional regulator [Dehalococcoidia bacterium]|nr:sigma-54 dependent transcriptional regulator [Dehalococcoidia bacterium]